MRRFIGVILVMTLVLLCASCNSARKKEVNDITFFDTVCTADEALEKAKASDTVVIGFEGCTSGAKVWDSFYERVETGKPASVLCAHYYTLDKEYVSEELYEADKDKYPQLYFFLLEYDGSTFNLKIRKSDEASVESQETYRCLLRMTGDAPKTALYESYERYVLCDDPDLTWEDIEKSMLSSVSPEFIKHCPVYEEYKGWKGA